MPSCAFPKCKHNTKTHSKIGGITFHKFPCDGPIRQKWVKIIRVARKDHEWTSNRYSRVCSDHFNSDDTYLTKKGLRKINKNALPIFQVNSTDPYYDEYPSTSELTSTKQEAKIKALRKKLLANRIILKQVRSRVQLLTKANKQLRERNIRLKRLLLGGKRKNGNNQQNTNDQQNTNVQQNMVWCEVNPRPVIVENRGIETLIVKIEPTDEEII